MAIPSSSETSDPFNFEQGELLLIDKPIDWTSFDAVNKIKYQIKRKYQKKIKVGHAGTLDPRATGLLVICTGRKTKTLESLQGMPKEYTGVFELGATTPTLDTESEIDERFPLDGLSLETLQEKAKEFVGDIQQFPPAHSAIKVKGKRAYQLAREGKEVELKSRTVNISEFAVLAYDAPFMTFRVRCSKGTYIRSLADDFGKAMNSGAYLKELRRTEIGNYSVKDAITPFQFEFMLNHGE